MMLYCPVSINKTRKHHNAYRYKKINEERICGVFELFKITLRIFNNFIQTHSWLYYLIKSRKWVISNKLTYSRLVSTFYIKFKAIVK